MLHSDSTPAPPPPLPTPPLQPQAVACREYCRYEPGVWQRLRIGLVFNLGGVMEKPLKITYINLKAPKLPCLKPGCPGEHRSGGVAGRGGSSAVATAMPAGCKGARGSHHSLPACPPFPSCHHRPGASRRPRPWHRRAGSGWGARVARDAACMCSQHHPLARSFFCPPTVLHPACAAGCTPTTFQKEREFYWPLYGELPCSLATTKDSGYLAEIRDVATVQDCCKACIDNGACTAYNYCAEEDGWVGIWARVEGCLVVRGLQLLVCLPCFHCNLSSSSAACTRSNPFTAIPPPLPPQLRRACHCGRHRRLALLPVQR